MKNRLCLSASLAALILPAFASAQTTTNPTIMSRLRSVGGSSGFQTDPGVASVPVIVGTIVSAVISLLGIIFIVLIILAGYSWMTSRGNEEQISKARETIRQAIIGLIIAVSAWTIWTFIFNRLIMQTPL